MICRMSIKELISISINPPTGTDILGINVILRSILRKQHQMLNNVAYSSQVNVMDISISVMVMVTNVNAVWAMTMLKVT